MQETGKATRYLLAQLSGHYPSTLPLEVYGGLPTHE